MEFDELIGKSFNFYGAAENQFKLNQMAWKAVEDENDGYRSCLGSVQVALHQQTIFFRTPIARVRLEALQEQREHLGEVVGYRLVDTKDGHVWLEFGTDNNDDYYPSFMFNYYPKPPVAAAGEGG